MLLITKSVCQHLGFWRATIQWIYIELRFLSPSILWLLQISALCLSSPSYCSRHHSLPLEPTSFLISCSSCCPTSSWHGITVALLQSPICSPSDDLAIVSRHCQLHGQLTNSSPSTTCSCSSHATASITIGQLSWIKQPSPRIDKQNLTAVH